MDIKFEKFSLSLPSKNYNERFQILFIVLSSEWIKELYRFLIDEFRSMYTFLSKKHATFNNTNKDTRKIFPINSEM